MAASSGKERIEVKGNYQVIANLHDPERACLCAIFVKPEGVDHVCMQEAVDPSSLTWEQKGGLGKDRPRASKTKKQTKRAQEGQSASKNSDVCTQRFDNPGDWRVEEADIIDCLEHSSSGQFDVEIEWQLAGFYCAPGYDTGQN